MINTAIITASDKGSRGEREDVSAVTIRECLSDICEFTAYEILPDEIDVLSEAMIRLSEQVNLILTTGGTGFSKRDITPEATIAVIERRTPGIPEAMRQKSLSITPKAMLTRAEAGIRGNCLIINMPGSPKACKECIEVIKPALEHGIEILLGIASECGNHHLKK